jgi:hypothetical protein
VNPRQTATAVVDAGRSTEGFTSPVDLKDLANAPGYIPAHGWVVSQRREDCLAQRRSELRSDGTDYIVGVRLTALEPHIPRASCQKSTALNTRQLYVKSALSGKEPAVANPGLA